MLRTRLTSGAQPEPVVADTATSLAALGHSVTLLAWDRDGSSDREAVAEWGQIVRYRRACPLNAPLAFLRELPRFWCWCLRQLLALHRDDLVVHAHDLDTLPLGLFAAKLLRTPLVYDCHENYPALVEGIVSRRFALWLHRREARLLRYCDGVLAAGPQGFARLSAMRRRGVSAPFNAPLEEALAILRAPQAGLVSDGVALVGNLKRLDDYPAAKVAARKPGKRLKILYIGVLEKRPSRGILETALAIEGLRDVEFLVGGFGTLVPQLERLCRRLRNTHYLGPVPPGDVARLTLEADAVLMALDPTNLNSRLSAPNKLFEAMCAGVPVITCRELLMGRFVAEERIGTTFAWSDWHALRRTARALRDSPATRGKMGQRGRALAESGFHWDAAAERMVQLYESALKR